MPGILNPDMMPNQMDSVPTPDGNSDGQTGDTQTPDGHRGNLSEDQQIALMLIEQQNNRRLMMARARQDQMNLRTPDGNSNGQVAQVQPGGTQTPGGQRSNLSERQQMALMLLEQQNKRRLMMARSMHENTMIASGWQPTLLSPPGTQTPNHALYDYQMALLQLEQQRNMARLMQNQTDLMPTPDGNSNGQVAQVQPGGTQTPGGQGSNHALRDYQMQLMQLEQQNNTGVPTPDGNSDDQTDGTQTPGGHRDNLSEEHQMALMLLEQQNKRRLTMARMENDFGCYGQPSPGQESSPPGTSFQGSNGAYSNPE